MKTQTLILLATTLVCISANAKTETKVATKAPASKCAACDENAKLIKDLQKLNITKDEERFKGEEIALKTVDRLQAFEKLAKKDVSREANFSSLLNLSREAVPYDSESQIAQVLSDLLKKDAGLKKSYDVFVKNMPKAAKTADQCKSENFEKTVAEQICLSKAGIGAKDTGDTKKDAKVQQCITGFDYTACLKSAKK